MFVMFTFGIIFSKDSMLLSQQLQNLRYTMKLDQIGQKQRGLKLSTMSHRCRVQVLVQVRKHHIRKNLDSEKYFFIIIFII